ncbi:MAG TPA: indole-3-glycerol phosphate synthase TrpC [Solirubrobacteraceae bacterium]|nr:indole-3-glycerol phosphate synthase TrpC [Solirubrobacteraceae bacterium]
MTSPRSPASAAPARPTVLQRIVAETRQELEGRKRSVPPATLEAQVTAAAGGRPGQPSDGGRGRFHEALASPGIGVIAEFKRRSPSAGSLREGADVDAIVGAYERGGASALSVLTEGSNFEGSLDDLRAARAASGLPILRKDFIVDPYQLYETRTAGADAVLLIAAALDRDELASLHELAATLGLDVLVEVHDRQELARAVHVGARLIGVNNRDLRDFSVDVRRTSRLLEEMPADATVVSESGITAPEQLRELERQGVSAALVGESLMRAPDPQRALAALLAGSSAKATIGGAGSSRAGADG